MRWDFGRASVKLGIVLTATFAALAFAGSAAAGPATTTVNSSINVVSPTTLTGTRDLDFGTIAKPTVGSTTVTLASSAAGAATPTVSGGNGYIPTAGLAHASTFHLIGTAGQTYSVSATTLTFTGSGGNLTTIGTEAPVAAGGTLNTLPPSGADDVYIGGHFDISSTTATQVYNGTLSLTINFN